VNPILAAALIILVCLAEAACGIWAARITLKGRP
jgi:hypothetical protein